MLVKGTEYMVLSVYFGLLGGRLTVCPILNIICRILILGSNGIIPILQPVERSFSSISAKR